MKTKTIIRFYFWSRLLNEPLFWGPILLLAMSKLAGMTNSDILISEALATLLLLILDAPSGVLADLVGRRVCVILGMFFRVISVSLLVFMSEKWHCYLANFFWALAVSLRSGAESALIYDFLKDKKIENLYGKINKNFSKSYFLLAFFTAIAAGFLAKIDLRLPLLLSLPGVFLSFVFTFYLPKDTVTHTDEHSLEIYFSHIKEAFMEMIKDSNLMKIVFWISVISVVGKFSFFTSGPYMEEVKIPYEYIGFIFAGINIFGFISSKYSLIIQKKLGKYDFTCLLFLQGTVMVFQAFFMTFFSGSLFLIHGFTRGYMNSLGETFLNTAIKNSKKRATLLSFQSSFSGLLSALFFALMSPLSNDIRTTLILIGIISLTLSFTAKRK
jgi:MFS family permease